MFRTDFFPCKFKDTYKATIYMKKFYKGGKDEKPSKVLIGVGFTDEEKNFIKVSQRYGLFPL